MGSRRAADRTPGPVTAALRVARWPHPGPLAVALRAWPAFLALGLARPALASSPLLGDYAGQVLGFDATLCLVGTLLVTPLLTVTRCAVAKLRWWYGVWMFVLGLAGLGLALLTAPGTPGERAAGDAASWTGTVLVVLLFPAAAMSNRACQKLLGPEWKRWQRWLVWAVWGLVLGHLLLLRDPVMAAGFVAASAPLIALRNGRVRRSVKAWRAGGYSTGRWWFVLAVCAACFLAGLTVLLAGEAEAVARALVLAPLPG